jgi:hypothetical protein
MGCLSNSLARVVQGQAECARRSGLTGIIALAPNGAPERLVHLFPPIAESVAQAQAMVAAGHGDDRASFTDMNIRGPFSVNTTAAIYLSFFEPTGPANMLDNISRLREPLLWFESHPLQQRVSLSREFDFLRREAGRSRIACAEIAYS